MSENTRKEELTEVVETDYPYVIEMCNITRNSRG